MEVYTICIIVNGIIDYLHHECRDGDLLTAVSDIATPHTLLQIDYYPEVGLTPDGDADIASVAADERWQGYYDGEKLYRLEEV